MKTFTGTIFGLLFVQALLTNPNALNEIFEKGNHTNMKPIQANSETFSASNPVYGEYFDKIGVKKDAVPYIGVVNHQRY